MKKLLLPVSFILLLLQASCITTERESATSKNADRVFSPTPEGQRARLTPTSVLNSVRTAHEFSDPKAKDRFVLLLQGTKIISSKARFLIISSKGDTLRNEVMPALALLNERDLEDPQAATVRDKEIAILKSMNNFFSEDKFTSPAVPRTMEAATVDDQEAWQAVREDNRSVGFDYTAAGGRERRLAYARKLNKTVIVAE
ncbi:hypothetical protein HER32_19840 [Hymenobacter sp. BT18]|uniref:hypothetical protein n=1 Tax=Hymenobacter sp. BT18 TaxID=2835648 RepID=UPI00143E6C05|nr:hypothetical protein [Hymenobacter sp. BT18]QIX63302.1 hypothetical protein HER32_19840 [Hymenobacter sp. BT18]